MFRQLMQYKEIINNYKFNINNRDNQMNKNKQNKDQKMIKRNDKWLKLH